MASQPLLPVSTPATPPSTFSAHAPTPNGKGRVAALRTGFVNSRATSPPAQRALDPSPTGLVDSGDEVSEKSSLWRASDVDEGNDGSSADGIAGRRKRRLMSLPVIIAFVICVVYLFCALAGVGYVDPSSLAPGSSDGPRPLVVPESWSSAPSRHQRQQAYAQAIGLSKGPTLEELKQMWG